jgi:8-oxo-dGTP pyrophosphatase MutT (NUDIX family)
MSRSLHPASAFVISCGTVTLDLYHSKALLIRCRTTGEVMLPKGRKDVGETLENAALRETWEETGYRASLLPLPIPTQATSPQGSQSLHLVTEPMCVTQRSKGGIQKIIFWFAAQADSTATECQRERQENEDFETLWTDVDAVSRVLTHEDDREVARLVVDAVRGGHLIYTWS